MKFLNRTLLLPVAAVFLFAQCAKDDGPTTSTQLNCFDGTGSQNLTVLNEGNFGTGNGSITHYNFGTEVATNGIYACANTGLPLGDVPNSLTKEGSNYYVVVNNSNKIEVLNATDYKREVTITGFSSPRHMEVVGTDKAYVTDLFSGTISILDLENNVISGGITTGSWSEAILLHNGWVFVTQPSREHMLVINPATDFIMDSVNVGLGGNSIVVDANNDIWVLADGGYQTASPSLSRIDPSSFVVQQFFLFPDVNESPNKLVMDNSMSNFYWLNNGVFKMGINDGALPSTAFVDGTGHLFYGLGVHPTADEVYVSDAVDYVSAGTVYRYNSVGTLVDEFTADVSPGFLFFD